MDHDEVTKYIDCFHKYLQFKKNAPIYYIEFRYFLNIMKHFYLKKYVLEQFFC